MSLQTVLDSIIFWDSSDHPTEWQMSVSDQNVVSSTTDLSFRQDFKHYIEVLYNGSQAMRDLLETASTNAIYVAEHISEPGRSFTLSNPPFIAINFDEIDNRASFNDKGQYVPELPELVIAHELAHRYAVQLGFPSHLDPQQDAVNENASYFDHKGNIVRFQNTVAAELGYEDAIRSSYLSSGDIADFSLWTDFTKGQSIDISRRAYIGAPLDTSTRTDASRDLLLGSEGADLIKSGDGADYLWGFEGNDTLEGGDGYDLLVGDAGEDILRGGLGNDELLGGDEDDILDGGSGDDFLVGGDGSDTLIGGPGNDELWGGDYLGEKSVGIDIADYSDADSSIKIVLNVDHEIFVHDGNGGMDSLHAIDMVVGTDKRDTFTLEGGISASAEILTIDARGGQGGNPADTINLSSSTSRTSLLIGLDGRGHIYDRDNNSYIYLEGFNTNIIGSQLNDQITDNSIGRKSIYAGDGDDEVSVGIGASLIDGGAGDDIITGGSANDVLIGGEGRNILVGGNGSDQLISSSNGDKLDGGEGHDLLKVAPDATEARLIGGAGNDVIDTRLPNNWTFPVFDRGPDEKVVYEFRSGDGHDVIMASLTTAPDDAWYNPYGDREFSYIGLDEIYLSDINRSEVSFVLNVLNVEVLGSLNSTYYLSASAELAIVVNSTGDSIYCGTVALTGHGYNDDGGDPTVLRRVNEITLPMIRFADGVLEYIGDAGMFSPTLGPVSQYNVAYGDFRAAVDSAGQGPIDGTSGNDLLLGGSGDDEVSAGAGDDEIETSGGSDEVDGGDGIDQLTTFRGVVGFTFERQSDGSVMVTSLNGLEGRTKIVNVEKIYSIADDETSDLSALAGEYGTPDDDILINGTTRADFLYGLAGDDLILGRGGDDVVDGGDGSDTASYLGNSSNYQIYNDVDGSVKVVDLTGGEGTDKLLNTEAILFAGNNVTILSASLPALGTTAADVLSGDGQANHLFGLDGDDVLDGGLGDDILRGGEGSDTYVVTAGGGNDTLIETANENFDEDVVDLTAFDPEDITLLRGTTQANSGDLQIKLNATGEIFTVHGQFADLTDRGVERLDFANSVSWDRTQIGEAAISLGTPGADILYGSPAGGQIDGNGGNDVVHSIGSDVILYHSDDGDLEIVDEVSVLEVNKWDDVDTLHLVDLNETDVTFVRNGRDLIIQIIATGNSITIKDQSNVDGHGSSYASNIIEFIQFSDEEAEDIEPYFASATLLPVYGTSGSDHLVGTFYDDEIRAGDGDDTIFGLDGVDILDGGAGNDTIGGGGAGSTLIGGSGDDTFLDPWVWGVTIDGGDGDDSLEIDSSYDSDFGFVFEQDGSLTVNYTGFWGPEDVANLTGVELIKFTGNNVTISTTDLSFVGNPAPELDNSLWDQVYERGDVLSIEIPLMAFSDPNDATLTYTATLADGSPLPSWLTLTDREFAGTVPTTVYGPLGIIVTASDGENSVSDQFTLFIGNPTNNEIYAQGTEYGTSANDLMYADGNTSISLYGDDGDDTIIADADEVLVHGEAGNDVLQATGLNIELEGGAGYDQFVFSIWSFNDLPQSTDTWATILDFEDGIDKVGLYDSVSGFGQIANKFTQVGNDVVLAATNLPKIIFKDTDISDLDASNFQFTPAEQQNPQQGLFSSQPETLFL